MYCKNCGREVAEGSFYCNNCGVSLYSIPNQNFSDDKASFGFAVLGFFFSLVGLILFLIYESKKPKRAKSAGKGALIGFIAKLVLYIISLILYVAFVNSVFSNTVNGTEENIPVIGGFFENSTDDTDLEDYVDASFGEFKIKNNGYSFDTSLSIKVKNKSDKRYTYFIEIEAVDETGARIDTDTIYANKLNAGQEINLTAFEYVDREKIDQFRSATFKILEIKKYSF